MGLEGRRYEPRRTDSRVVRIVRSLTTHQRYSARTTNSNCRIVVGEGGALCSQMALHSSLSLQGAVSKILIIGEDEDNVGSGPGGFYASANT